VIDLLMERSPRFLADWLEIRQRMNCGRFMTHEEIRRQVLGE